MGIGCRSDVSLLTIIVSNTNLYLSVKFLDIDPRSRQFPSVPKSDVTRLRTSDGQITIYLYDLFVDHLDPNLLLWYAVQDLNNTGPT